MTAKSAKNGGSALKRLKTSLKEAGIIGSTSRKNVSKRQKKKGNPKEVGKNDTKTKIDHINKTNPFELKITKTKHDVLGRKVKGVQGRPGLKRQIGIEKRKKTLLVEMENKNRVGGMIDRRFGENNPEISPEEKMLERFKREKQRQSKSTLFNLEDEDELTHYGQSLSLIDDFHEPDLALSDDEDEGIVGLNVCCLREPEHKKTKAEVMKEVIAKSKMHKYERQFEKEESERVRHELDNEIEEIRNLLIVPPKRPAESQELSSQKSVSDQVESEQNDKDNEYDRIVRELAFEKRARPTDRTKTEEEIALEEKEKLEKLERARKRRMQGLDSESEEENEKRKKQKRVPIADDLEDDYISDENDDKDLYGLGKGIGLADFAINGALLKKSSKSSREHGTIKVGGKKELAYIFPCPISLEELLEILDNVDDSEIPTVIHRIRVLHNIKLSPDNEEKLKKLFQVIIDYILHRVAQEVPIPTILVNKLVVHIFDLAHQFPETAGSYFIVKIAAMQNRLTKELSSMDDKSSKSPFPYFSELVLLKILSQIFPTSDFHHTVVTPTTLLMGQYLAQCPLLTGRDLVAGIFLCNLMHEFQTLAQRVCPEVLNFLNTALVLLAPKGAFASTKSIPGTFPISERLTIDLQIEDASNIKEIHPLKFSRLLGLKASKRNDIFNKDEFRVSALNAILYLVEKYSKLYSSTAAFIELFSATSKILSLYPIDRFSEIVKTKVVDMQGKLTRLQKFAHRNRKPLELHHHRPIPLPTYIPKFQEKFSIDKNYDPDRERARLNKLKAQYKKERKGAIRELRKDTQFIARHDLEKIREKDTAYKKKISGIMGILEVEQGEKKAYEKAKKYGKL
ncbi:17304_t:CDS:10 [Acaulospora colombiana]|uniref:17304_t:CDS:1 n=1 Tax=Acaulospora colombiana TaxID=27376 RepID=A0ACA9LZG3_9GLOM|nr:17304_t:CDS:10 [Acaulospora colombiana]